MKKDELLSRVHKAIRKLIELDFYLLRVDASERSICHKLAIYLEKEFSEYSVDCEYNKDLGDTKRLQNVKNYVRKQRSEKKLADVEESYGICVSPDIIIHSRGVELYNLLVIEFKKTGRPGSETAYDYLKLRGYIHEVYYQYGLFIELGTGEGIKINKAKLYTRTESGEVPDDVIRYFQMNNSE